MADYEAGLRFRSDSRDIVRSDRDLEHLERQSGRTERAADKLGRTIKRAFAAAGAGIILRQIIRNTIEQEKAETKLNAVLRSTARYSDDTSKALIQLAQNYQRLTGVGDDLIINAEAQLLTFKELGSEVFPRAVMSVLDLSAVMDQDLRTSVVAIGKALNDPVRGIDALSRAGIQFTDEQKALIKELVRTGKTLDAQKLILGELESQFGGAAREARNTFGGAIKGLQASIGDLLEGDTRSGGLKGATQAFNDLSDALNDPEVQAGFDVVISGIGRTLQAAARAPQILGFFGKSIKVALGQFDDADLKARDLELGQLQHRIEVLTELADRGAFGPLNPVIRRRIEALQEELELKRKLLLADLTAPGAAPGSSAPDLSGLDADPLAEIVVNAKARTSEFKEIQREVAAGLRDIEKTAAEELRQALNDLAAQQGGESVEAAIRLADTLAMLDEQEKKLAATGGLTEARTNQLTQARALAVQTYNEEIAAIEAEDAAKKAELSTTEQLIRDLEFELITVGLGNKARQEAITLRYADADATEEQRRRIQELVQALQKEAETARNLDEFRASFSDAFATAAKDIRSVGDALDTLTDRILDIILRNLGDKLAESLFGAFGASQVGGSAGGSGFFSSLLGNLFGGGRQHGGPVRPGRVYEVGERGPELLEAGGRQFLIPGPQGGTVNQIDNRRNTRQSISIVVPQTTSRDTAAQIQRRTSRALREFDARA